MKPEQRTVEIIKETLIAAPIEIAWEAMIAEMTVESQMPDGKPFPFVLEQQPGGRWYRDLGNDAGHLWGHVQVIKPPRLLELCGPMFMSFPAINHIQYRLAAEENATRLTLSHRGFGQIPDDVASGMDEGWGFMVKHINEIARRLVGERKEK